MDGLLIIDKPAGITSHDVVARVRRALKTKRVGHTGTLDPFATGVMVILVGKATRLAQFLDKDEKEYEALIRFGFETDTGDNTGTPKSPVQGPTSIEISQVESVLAKFRGSFRQTPPMYSAKKVAGKKLYELARKGMEIERPSVEVTTSKLEMIIDSELPTHSVRIRVACSAGTYIRTLAEDIGREIGVGAHLTELRRTRSGRFRIDETIQIANASKTDLKSIALAVEHLPNFVLREDRVAKTMNGMSTRDLSNTFANGDLVRMTTSSGELVAIGFYDDAEKVVQPKVVLS
jgi:tRNA pseudouridine55 synthase